MPSGYGEKELQFNGTKKAGFIATANVNIVQKTLVEGDGVELKEVTGNAIRISVKNATTGHSATSEKVLADTDFSNGTLRRRYYTETWENGVLTDRTLGAWEVYHTAVEETV